MLSALLRLKDSLSHSKQFLFSHKELVIYQGRLSPSLPKPSAPVGFTFSLLSSEQLTTENVQQSLIALGTSPRYAQEKWKKHEICAAAYEGESLVGVQWASPTPTFVPEIGRAIIANPQRWYLHDLALAPSVRGLGLSSPLIRWTLTELAALGAEEIVTLVECDNVISHRAMRRSGFGHAGRLRFLRVGPFSQLQYRGYHTELKRLVGL
jgi:RimJ/RimL family protein N-acetyltransferase